jgi:hypothetical protein
MPAPANVLRSDATVPTRRRSSRASRAAGSAAAATSEGSRGVGEVSEPQPAATTTEPLRVAVEAQQAAMVAGPRQSATVAEPQQAASVMAATTAVAVAAPPTSPVPAAAGSSRAAVVEIPDDDVLPPGWDQWASPPASAPEASVGALVARATSGQRWGTQLMVSRPHRRTPDPWRVRSGRMPTRRRSTVDGVFWYT